MIKLSGSTAIVYDLSGVVLILGFGSVHFLAWSSGSTDTDKSLWKTCPGWVTVLPVFTFLLETCGENLHCIFSAKLFEISGNAAGMVLGEGRQTSESIGNVYELVATVRKTLLVRSPRDIYIYYVSVTTVRLCRLIMVLYSDWYLKAMDEPTI